MRKYDTFWSRFFALILDSIVLAITKSLLGLIPTMDSQVFTIVSSLVFTSLPFVYAILMVGGYGQTVGKMIMNVRVVLHDVKFEMFNLPKDGSEKRIMINARNEDPSGSTMHQGSLSN
ncbi:hypothetical protein BH10BAC4_BH10BAC4_19090 [soil metagenome]